MKNLESRERLRRTAGILQLSVNEVAVDINKNNESD